MRYLLMSLVVMVGSTCYAQNTAKTKYESGKVKSEYVQKSGLVAITSYYETGEVKETGFFKDEIPEGKWETFAKDGSKTAELTYKNGKRHGEFRVWDGFSNAYIEMKYVNGEIISANRYLKETEFAAKNE